MFALIAFLVGLFVLFKGAFRLGAREISRPQSRSIALILMAPLVIYFCASSILVYNNIQFNADGTFTISADAFDYIAGTVGWVELITVGLALLLVVYQIYGAPQQTGSTPLPTRAQQPSAPARVPDIMTVAEAAAYMQVTQGDVLALIEQGKLGAARIGDSYRIARIAIDDFIART